MASAMEKHLAAIKAGEVTKTNVIGLRKALNHNERVSRGWSRNRNAATPEEVSEAVAALGRIEPRVVGDLYETGLTVLQNKRYRKRLAEVQPIIDTLESFHLVDFENVGKWYYTPVYEARSPAGRFTFVNVPWQSGGDGPEVRTVSLAN